MASRNKIEHILGYFLQSALRLLFVLFFFLIINNKS